MPLVQRTVCTVQCEGIFPPIFRNNASVTNKTISKKFKLPMAPLPNTMCWESDDDITECFAVAALDQPPRPECLMKRQKNLTKGNM